MRRWFMLLMGAAPLLLASCANVPSDFKFDPKKASGLVVGSISYETSFGKYVLAAQSEESGTGVAFSIGCAFWPCFETTDDPAYSKGETPKQRAGGFALELPAGKYRLTGWWVRRGDFLSRSATPFSIPFVVEQGHASYLGNLHFDGEWENVTLRDRASRDLPLLNERYAALRAAPLAHTIAPGVEISKLGGAYDTRLEYRPVPIYIPVRPR